MRTVLYIAIATVFLGSCNKGSDIKKGSPNPRDNVAIDTKVEGLKDVVMKQTDVYEMPIVVKYISGTKEKVSIALVDMPEHVFVSITPQIDTPNYSSILKFNAMSADTGTTKITLITAASKDSSTRTYSFNLTITPSPVNYALDLAGTYIHSGTCENVGAVNNTAYITADPNVINRIKIEKIWTGTSNSYYLYADINSVNHTINIPAQSNNGILYTGNGTYTDNKINISYQFTDGNLIKDNCTVTLSR